MVTFIRLMRVTGTLTDTLPSLRNLPNWLSTGILKSLSRTYRDNLYGFPHTYLARSLHQWSHLQYLPTLPSRPQLPLDLLQLVPYTVLNSPALSLSGETLGLDPVSPPTDKVLVAVMTIDKMITTGILLETRAHREEEEEKMGGILVIQARMMGHTIMIPLMIIKEIPPPGIMKEETLLDRVVGDTEEPLQTQEEEEEEMTHHQMMMVEVVVD